MLKEITSSMALVPASVCIARQRKSSFVNVLQNRAILFFCFILQQNINNRLLGKKLGRSRRLNPPRLFCPSEPKGATTIRVSTTWTRSHGGKRYSAGHDAEAGNRVSRTVGNWSENSGGHSRSSLTLAPRASSVASEVSVQQQTLSNLIRFELCGPTSVKTIEEKLLRWKLKRMQHLREGVASVEDGFSFTGILPLGWVDYSDWYVTYS